MEKFGPILVLLGFATICSAIFFPLNLQNLKQPMTRVCITSVDPSRYAPKCFMCPTSVYQSVLTLCVQMAVMPSNVTYTQANCLEQNCLVRGKRSVSSSQEGDGPNSLDHVPFPGLRLHDLNSPSETKEEPQDEEAEIDAEEETNAGEAEYVIDMEGVDEAIGEYE